MPRHHGPRPTAVAAVAALTTTAAWRALQARPPGGAARWTRSNFRGEPLSLALGPAVAAGALAGLAVAGRQDRRAGLLLVTATAAVGLYDDLYGDRHARGLRGHLRALRQGRVTTGLVKLVGLASAAGVAAALRRQRPAAILVDSVLVAGTANLVNLLDLRPGRAAKVSVAKAAGLLAAGAGGPAAAALGAATAALPPDLGERGMLGDCGANTLGALVGWAASRAAPPVGRAGLAAVVVAITLAGERVSFSAVIDGHPGLRAVDRAGAAPR
jgi:UDP-N-acetylmuramyl pentapeptide phosphotransferase/UDP-N-acetylglucosamine-1-phosphate transferase